MDLYKGALQRLRLSARFVRLGTVELHTVSSLVSAVHFVSRSLYDHPLADKILPDMLKDNRTSSTGSSFQLLLVAASPLYLEADPAYLFALYPATTLQTRITSQFDVYQRLTHQRYPFFLLLATPITENSAAAHASLMYSCSNLHVLPTPASASPKPAPLLPRRFPSYDQPRRKCLQTYSTCALHHSQNNACFPRHIPRSAPCSQYSQSQLQYFHSPFEDCG